MERWIKFVENEGDFVEKLFQLCKECTQGICKFRSSFIMVFGIKIGGLTFIPPLLQ